VGTVLSSCGLELRGNKVGGSGDGGVFESLKVCFRLAGKLTQYLSPTSLPKAHRRLENCDQRLLIAVPSCWPIRTLPIGFFFQKEALDAVIVRIGDVSTSTVWLIVRRSGIFSETPATVPRR
jgi:hypothetical protein